MEPFDISWLAVVEEEADSALSSMLDEAEIGSADPEATVEELACETAPDADSLDGDSVAIAVSELEDNEVSAETGCVSSIEVDESLDGVTEPAAVIADGFSLEDELSEDVVSVLNTDSRPGESVLRESSMDVETRLLAVSLVTFASVVVFSDVL